MFGDVKDKYDSISAFVDIKKFCIQTWLFYLTKNISNRRLVTVIVLVGMIKKMLRTIMISSIVTHIYFK